MDFPHLSIPEIDIRVFEVQALGFARHISGARHGEGLAVALKIVFVYAETRARAKIGFVADPEARVVTSANLLSIEELRLNDVQAFSTGRGQDERFGRGDI